MSWILPALLLRAAVRDWAYNRGLRTYRAAGLLAGTTAGVTFLVASAAVVGP